MLDTCKILLINLLYTLFSIRNKLSAFSLGVPLTLRQTQPQFLLKIFFKFLETSNTNNNPDEAITRRSIVFLKSSFFMCTFLFYQNVLIETTKGRCKSASLHNTYNINVFSFGKEEKKATLVLLMCFIC